MATLLSLAEGQRVSQQKLKDALDVRLTTSYKATVGPRDTRALVDRWISLVLPTILAYRKRSEAYARLSYAASRALVAPGDVWTPPAAPAASEEAIRVSLLATGFAGLLASLNEQKLDLATSLEHAATLAAGAASRHALNGGREFTKGAIAADKVALGWYRVTRPGCCYFCAALASRGAVYKGDSFDDSDPRFVGDGDVKVHDHCTCSYAPQWKHTDEIQSSAAEYQGLWYASTKGFSGNNAMNAFRRAFEVTYPAMA